MTTPLREQQPSGTTGELHFLSVVQPLRRGMKRREEAVVIAAVECVLRVVTTEDGRTVIQIEVPDEKARLQLSAALLRAGD